ncbi:hypothetical protein LK994_11130 [Ferruginibacter lapsinanis]|uniref:hypothetical protein n=1 Tax=Ferruginibacter lapsinanis TaxID=563172 RepID=UPI001E5B7EE0|nr:hypothetical protein [Ferruginibacter lapsinanis]UEG49184.1 hypothetical protein LK994_11130 [Ferruginibacter lapsinanis]
MAAFNLIDEIIKEHTKAQCEKIVHWVGASQLRFDQLFNLFLQNQGKITQRSAWPVSYCIEAHPELIQKHFPALLKNLQHTNLHDAVKRNSIRLLQYTDIPKKYQGRVMDICFQYLASPAEAVAVKVFSLYVLIKLSRLYPEILPEIKLMVEEQLPHQTAAFKSAAKKVLTKK